MSQLFSTSWMESFAEAWNSDPALYGELEKINFDSVIGTLMRETYINHNMKKFEELHGSSVATHYSYCLSKN